LEVWKNNFTSGNGRVWLYGLGRPGRGFFRVFFHLFFRINGYRSFGGFQEDFGAA
jgi:hypothetical protein